MLLAIMFKLPGPRGKLPSPGFSPLALTWDSCMGPYSLRAYLKPRNPMVTSFTSPKFWVIKRVRTLTNHTIVLPTVTCTHPLTAFTGGFILRRCPVVISFHRLFAFVSHRYLIFTREHSISIMDAVPTLVAGSQTEDSINYPLTFFPSPG